MPDCPPRTIFGRPACRFEARYDLGPADVSGAKFNSTREGEVATMIDKLRSKTYIRDVCTRCGKTIEREGK